MPPKEEKRTWTDAVERDFLLEILSGIEATVPPSVLQAIAEKWGAPHTKGSLMKKWSRMNLAFKKSKEGDDAEARNDATSAVKDAAADENKDEADNSKRKADSGVEETQKTKKPRATKAKKEVVNKVDGDDENKGDEKVVKGKKPRQPKAKTETKVKEEDDADADVAAGPGQVKKPRATKAKKDVETKAGREGEGDGVEVVITVRKPGQTKAQKDAGLKKDEAKEAEVEEKPEIAEANEKKAVDREKV